MFNEHHGVKIDSNPVYKSIRNEIVSGKEVNNYEDAMKKFIEFINRPDASTKRMFDDSLYILNG